MPAQAGQRIKIVAELDILKKYSDEENPISAAQICEKLNDMGIPAERKAIYKDIDLLIDYGFDICKTRTPKTGVFLASREFEVPEIYLLCDAVQAASFISVKKTRTLVKKLSGMLSVGENAKIKKNIYIDNGHKSSNEEIYYNIDALSNAIEKRKKISLEYIVRYADEKGHTVADVKKMKISPYALIWQNDHYYLVGNNEKYDNLIHLRVDRMKKVTLTDEPFRHFKEVSEYKETFDAADYSSKSFSMYSGELGDIELRCSAKMLEQVIDRFSENINARKIADGKFSVFAKAIISDGLASWIMQYGDEIEAVAPQELRDMIYKKASLLKEIYK